MVDLKFILQQYPDCLNSRTFFKSILKDIYPSEKRMINILTLLVDCGIANKIKSMKSIDSDEMHRLIVQAESEYGIAERYAQDAILIWAAAFDVTVSAVKTYASTSSIADSAGLVKQAPVVYVQGDADEYDVIQQPDGYYISHFNGFEQEDMTIPSMIEGKRIKGIGQEAFKGCVTVKRIRISEGIEIIENSAFKECKALEEVVLPDTLRQIGSESKKYGVGAFFSTNLKEVILPPNVEFLGPYSFGFCSNMRKVEMSDRITTIHEGTFYFCTHLEDIRLPSGLLKIEKSAFENCKSLQEVHIPVGTQLIGNQAFGNTNIKGIFIPPTVTKIGEEPPNSGLGRYYVFGNSTVADKRLNHLTIYCSGGSAAMEYARNNNIKCAKAQF